MELSVRKASIDIEAQLRKQLTTAEFGLRSALRLSQTALTVSPKAIAWLLARRKPSPVELRELFESLGTTYIKFGQLIASSPSLFPKAYVDEFQKLLDQTSTISFHKIQSIVEEDLGRPLSEVFERFSSTPLASASIAQVHAATLKTGEDVVVKVQKPGVQAIISADMNTAYVFARVMELVTPNVDREAIAGMIAELYQAMIDECDFTKEAQNLEDFMQFLATTQNNDVVAPKPYVHVSGQKVLVMERFYGSALTDLKQLEKLTDNPAETLMVAMNTWFTSLTQCEAFHADLHNGNIMVLDNGKVAFIDFGMVGRIASESWQAVFDLLGGLSEQNYQVVAQSMLTIGITRESIDVDQLAKDIEQLFTAVYDIEPDKLLAHNGLSNIDDAMSNLGEIAKRYGIRFPRAFTLLLKQFLYFDRYIELLAPGMDMFDQNVINASMPLLD